MYKDKENFSNIAKKCLPSVMIAFVLSAPNDTLLGSLLFQKNRDFKVYVPENEALYADYEARLPLVKGGLNQVDEPLVCFLEPGAVPDKDFVRRVLRAQRRHPSFDLYHVNLAEGKKWPRRLKGEKLFRMTVYEGAKAPLSTFIFRTAALRECAVFRADGTLDALPTILACAKGKIVRNVWRQRLQWTEPQIAADPQSEERRIREKLDFYRWTESIWGEDDYPLDLGERLELITGALAGLYPTYSDDYLKEILSGFHAAQGPIRKIRASSALKGALRRRQKELEG